jgi:hypothetical protein
MTKPKPFRPATNLAGAYNAVNPDQSLLPGDARYVDFSPFRGDEQIVNMIARSIIWTDQDSPPRYLKQLVTGHRGCGKTTELLLLKARLEAEEYFVVFFDSEFEVDMNDVDYADILLATLHQLETQVRESPLKLKLDPARLEDLAMRLAKVTLEKEDRKEVELALENEFRVEPQIPFFARMMAAVRGFIKDNTTYKKQLRLEIQQRTAQFLEDLNDLVDQLQTQLRERGKKGLVVIIDSLDRIIPHPLENGRRTTHSAIYLEHADHLKAPRCHIIYTIPISIFFNENVISSYPDHPLMLPMIKIREENEKISRRGLAEMRKAITYRVDEALFEDPKSIDRLCQASGGHIRDLMFMMRFACHYSEEKISALAADKAIRALVRQYDRLVKDADLPRLVKVHREKRLPSDPEYALLPYHLIVLEYQNEDGERWADVHPAVQETLKFREAWKNAQKQTAP